jgi:hypothetical protein
VLPLHTTVSPIGTPAGPAARRGPIRALLLTSLVLAAAAAMLGGTPGHLALTLAVSVLATAAVVGMRSHWVSAGPAPTPAVDAVPEGAGELTPRLQQLHDDHAEQVNLALEEGREDLVQELSDTYMDQALALITADAGVRP